MRKAKFGFILLAGAMLLGGCASSSDKQSAAQKQAAKQGKQVSDLPWNRPPSWQQAGAAGAYLGGMGATTPGAPY
ncbi:hypothetical protein MAMC_01975 [Methylacidimicrobium cyclopophantes]|uniref:Lipoprotein n=1 Tax=Methylacidimicrobium cyclopophantes TaxID=1041766 RepID=A0A5E6MF17_9BACT|nr:hypothetical protein [Methylacidimicrobium cyclopophantes]VVM08084.1 hypothetical protein MAMC_01975 [Methylacidimicrobium cyclopophantes]